MANLRNSNTYCIDTAYSTNEELAVRNIRVSHIVVTATCANAILVLGDAGLGTKVKLHVAATNTSQLFDFSDAPLVFSTSIRPTTVTNCVATCVIQESRG